jgi:hypothetical protein
MFSASALTRPKILKVVDNFKTRWAKEVNPYQLVAPLLPVLKISIAIPLHLRIRVHRSHSRLKVKGNRMKVMNQIVSSASYSLFMQTLSPKIKLTMGSKYFISSAARRSFRLCFTTFWRLRSWNVSIDSE